MYNSNLFDITRKKALKKELEDFNKKLELLINTYSKKENTESFLVKMSNNDHFETGKNQLNQLKCYKNRKTNSKDLSIINDDTNAGFHEKTYQSLKKEFPNIFHVYEKNKGLCDLLCNYITLNNPIKHKHNKPMIEYFTPDFDLQNNNDLPIKLPHPSTFNFKKINALSKTHILLLISFIEILLFLLFKKIPHSIFSPTEQRNLLKSKEGLNSKLLIEKLTQQPIGKCIKFSQFQTGLFGVPNGGHSMLIIKTDNDQFMFFNPDSKNPKCEFFNAADELCIKITYTMNMVNQNSTSKTQIAFIDNDAFMKRIHKKLCKNDINQLSDIKKEDDEDTLEI